MARAKEDAAPVKAASVSERIDALLRTDLSAADHAAVWHVRSVLHELKLHAARAPLPDDVRADIDSL